MTETSVQNTISSLSVAIADGVAKINAAVTGLMALAKTLKEENAKLTEENARLHMEVAKMKPKPVRNEDIGREAVIAFIDALLGYSADDDVDMVSVKQHKKEEGPKR